MMPTLYRYWWHREIVVSDNKVGITTTLSFTYDFLPAIQIRWKLRLAVIPLLAIKSQQIFVHATTAQLSCHVQNFVAITVVESKCEWNEISIEFELRWKNRLWNGALELPAKSEPCGHSTCQESCSWFALCCVALWFGIGWFYIPSNV